MSWKCVILVKSDRLAQFSALWSYLLWVLKGQKRNRKGEERSWHLIVLCFRVPQRRGPPQPASLWEVPWGLGSGMIAFLFWLFLFVHCTLCLQITHCTRKIFSQSTPVSAMFLRGLSEHPFLPTIYFLSFSSFFFFFFTEVNTACVYKGRT